MTIHREQLTSYEMTKIRLALNSHAFALEKGGNQSAADAYRRLALKIRNADLILQTLLD